MKLNIFGYEITIKSEGKTLAKQGQKALKDRSLTKIKSALDEIENKGLKYSEYRVQQLSGVSLNTVKKYRSEIEAYRSKISRSLI